MIQRLRSVADLLTAVLFVHVFFFFRYIVPPEHGKRLERLAKGRISSGPDKNHVGLRCSLFSLCGGAVFLHVYALRCVTSVTNDADFLFWKASFQETHKAAKLSCVTR